MSINERINRIHISIKESFLEFVDFLKKNPEIIEALKSTGKVTPENLMEAANYRGFKNIKIDQVRITTESGREVTIDNEAVYTADNGSLVVLKAVVLRNNNFLGGTNIVWLILKENRPSFNKGQSLTLEPVLNN